MPTNLNSSNDPFDGLGEPVVVKKQQQPDPFGGLGSPVNVKDDPFGGLGTRAGEELDPYEKQRKEVEDASIFGVGLGSIPTTEEDIKIIAEKHGVNPADLQSVAPYLGAETGKYGDIPKAVAGSLGEAIGAGIPQKLYILSQEPRMRAALDDLRELALARQSTSRRAVEMLGPGAAVKGGAKLLTKLGTAATIGAVSGVAGSRTGEEIEGAKTGALFMGGLVGGLHVGGKAWAKASKFLHPEQQRELAEAVNKRSLEINKGAETVLENSKVGDELAHRVIRGEVKKVSDLPTEEVMRVVDELSPAQVEKAINLDTTRGAVYGKAVYGDIDTAKAVKEVNPERYEDSIKEFMARKRVEDTVKQYVKDVTGTPISKSTDLAAELAEYRQGGKYTPDEFNRWKKEQASIEYLQTEHLKAKDPTWRPLRMAQQFFSDVQHVANSVDERLGTNLSRAVDLTARGLNHMTFLKAATDVTRKKLVDISAKANLSAEDITNLIESGVDPKSLDPAKGAALTAWKDALTSGENSLLNMLRRGFPEANIPGLPVKERPNYVPHVVKEPAEFVATMQKLAEDVQKKFKIDLQAMTQQEYKALVNQPEMKKLIDGISWLHNNKPADVTVFRRYLQDATSLMPARKSLMTKASATFEREGEIPDFLREKNILKIWDRYIANNFRHMFLRESLDEIRRTIPVVRQAGDEITANYLERYINDQVGARANVPAALPSAVSQAIKLKATRKSDASNSDIAKTFWKAIAESPDLLSTMFNNIYPNFLGYNARAVIRNMTQVPSMVGTQLGGGYGSLSSFLGMAEALAPKHWNRYHVKLKEWGLEPAKFSGEHVDAIKSGLLDTTLWKVPAWVIDKQAKVGMYLYGLTDNYNRVATMSVAERMAKQLTDSSHPLHNSAIKALQLQPTQVRRVVAKAVEMGDEERVFKELATHLIASTQFHYNKAAMSEFGRTMGPIFSTFSKWPTAVAGDIMSKWETEGLGKGTIISARKYLAPLLFASAVQHLVYGAPEDMSDREKFFIGQNGLAEWVPGWAVSTMSSFMRPAFFDSLAPLFMAPAKYAVSGDTEQFNEDVYAALSKAGAAFIPGAGLMRLLLMDIPTVDKGYKPEPIREQVRESF